LKHFFSDAFYQARVDIHSGARIAVQQKNQRNQIDAASERCQDNGGETDLDKKWGKSS
jgi:hypothetical protein